MTNRYRYVKRKELRIPYTSGKHRRAKARFQHYDNADNFAVMTREERLPPSRYSIAH